MRTGSETLLFSLQICGFAICGLIQQGNWRTYVLRINNYKFADCGFSICGLAHFRNLRFAKAEWAQEIADLQFADQEKKLAWPLLNECWTVRKHSRIVLVGSHWHELLLYVKTYFTFSTYTRLCVGNSWWKLGEGGYWEGWFLPPPPPQHIIEKLFIQYLGNILCI
jgi:hypothetical protein